MVKIGKVRFQDISYVNYEIQHIASQILIIQYVGDSELNRYPHFIYVTKGA